MTVSATSSPVMLLTNAVEPAKATASTTANSSADAGAGEFQQMLAQAAEGARATGGVALLTGKAAAQGDGAVDKTGDAGNVLPLLTDLLPAAPVVAMAQGDAKVEGEPEHKSSDEKTDSTDQTDQAVTLLVTLPVLPPVPVVPANTVSVPAQTTTGEAQVAALSAAPSAAQLLKGDNAVDDAKDALNSELQDAANGVAQDASNSSGKEAAKRAANTGDALAIAATITPATATATANAAADLARLSSTGGDSGTGDNKSDFAELLKQLDTSTAVPSSGSVDSGRAVQQADRAYLQSTPATATVSLPMGSAAWPDAVADKVMWFSANKITSAEIHLNPPDLGPIQVHISTQQDQASVYFTSQHASVRAALDQALPRLRDMMDGQGIQLANAGVGGQGSSPQQQQDYRGNSDGRARASADGFFRERDDDAEPMGVSSVASARLARSGIDAYA